MSSGKLVFGLGEIEGVIVTLPQMNLKYRASAAYVSGLRGAILILLLLVVWTFGNLVPVLGASVVPPQQLIVPGKSLGQVNIGMNEREVKDLLGKPDKESKGYWIEYAEGNTVTDYFFNHGVLMEIRFGSKQYRTADGIGIATYLKKNWHDRYEYARTQNRFMNSRQILKGQGLAFYHLNLDSTDPKSPVESLGLIFEDHPIHEPLANPNEPDNGWHPWDGDGASLWEKIHPDD